MRYGICILAMSTKMYDRNIFVIGHWPNISLASFGISRYEFSVSADKKIEDIGNYLCIGIDRNEKKPFSRTQLSW